MECQTTYLERLHLLLHVVLDLLHRHLASLYALLQLLRGPVLVVEALGAAHVATFLYKHEVATTKHRPSEHISYLHHTANKKHTRQTYEPACRAAPCGRGCPSSWPPRRSSCLPPSSLSRFS